VGGIVNATLGHGVPLELPFDTTYWLGISIEGESELPRTELTSAPYALRAPSDPLVLPYSGEVASSGVAFSVANLDSGAAIHGTAGGTGEAGFFSIVNLGSTAAALTAHTEGTGPALYSYAAGGGKAGHFEGDVYVEGGSLGIGVPNPSAGLDVAGTAKMGGFQLTDAPSPGLVLTSDVSGVGTWQPAAGNIGGGGTADYVPKFTGTTSIGSSVIYETGGQVAIGTTTVDGKLTVENAGSVPALKITSTSPGSGFPVLHVEHTEDMQLGDWLVLLETTQNSTGGLFIRCYKSSESGGYSPFSVDLDGGITSGGRMDITSDEDRVISAHSTYGSSDTRVIHSRYTSIGNYDATAVYGESKPQDYYGYGGQFVGGYVGAYGLVEPTGSSSYAGLQGACNGGTGINYGVIGDAIGSGLNYGVHGSAAGGATNWAGWFNGDVNVTGTFYNPASALLLDHPLDPGEQYLRQPAVHSDEMKNIYDGVVALDSAGEAWVELPDWCEALNTEFRYQLTAIGAPGPNLYIADEVAGNRFRIAGGDSGMKVSWMLTGVRQDAHARANGILVEERKRAEDRGKYLHPEAHGASPTLGIGRLADNEEKLRP